MPFDERRWIRQEDVAEHSVLRRIIPSPSGEKENEKLPRLTAKIDENHTRKSQQAARHLSAGKPLLAKRQRRKQDGKEVGARLDDRARGSRGVRKSQVEEGILTEGLEKRQQADGANVRALWCPAGLLRAMLTKTMTIAPARRKRVPAKSIWDAVSVPAMSNSA
jgi:hypothetical protein